MFCPECGSENDVERYCRRCGKSLSAVRLALDGRIDEAIKIVQGEEGNFRYRLRIVRMVFLILVSIATIFTGGWFGFSNLQSAAVILIIVLLLYLQSARKAHRVARLLNTQTPSGDLGLSKTNERAALNSSSSTASVATPDASVIERETIRLNR